MHPETGVIWEHEHGPKGGDEINVIQAGANYGWPIITYGINYSGSPITDKTTEQGMTQPQYYWVPSIAPCGMAFVTSDRYPGWKNQLLIGSLKFAYVELVRLKGTTVIGREKIAENIANLCWKFGSLLYFFGGRVRDATWRSLACWRMVAAGKGGCGVGRGRLVTGRRRAAGVRRGAATRIITTR